MKSKAGFTLVELLVVVTIIGLLCAMGYGGYNMALQHAHMANEIGAAKTLTAAYSAYSTDNAGRLMPGYDRTVGSVTLPDGNTVGGPTAQRYPYRLASYFDYKIQGTILVNDNARQITANNTYMISCFPALGMNYIYVGGDLSSSGVASFPTDCITMASQAQSSLLVFASGGSGSNADRMDGYCILTPPSQAGPMWQTTPWTKDVSPDAYGHVDARYSGKAVCAFLDGSVRMLTIDDLRDMRLWNNNAAASNNASYVIAQQPASSGTGRPTR